MSKDTVEKHQKFAEKLGLQFPLLYDEGGKIAALYGTGRMTFVIDKAGIVRFVKKGMPSVPELLKVVEEIGG